MKSPISIYFHIPFCQKKCPYCHFYSAIFDETIVPQFLSALHKEWMQRIKILENTRIVSIYFGGGSPDTIAPDGINEILRWVNQSHLTIDPQCEITIEMNPTNVSLERCRSLQLMGVNRVSIGVQSLDDAALVLLERTHTADDAKEAVVTVHNAGINNISIDLMYDLPRQTQKSWEKTLQDASSLPITHLSLYNLTIEPHTRFFQRRDELKKVLPDATLSLALLETAMLHFAYPEWKRYEISAFAKNGLYSVHNTGYWTNRPFLGLGPSAFSYDLKKRFQNGPSLKRYIALLQKNESPVTFEETLPYPDNINEEIAIRLRMLDGFSEKNVAIPEKTEEIMNGLVIDGLLEHTDDNWRLTKRGALFYDNVAEAII